MSKISKQAQVAITSCMVTICNHGIKCHPQFRDFYGIYIVIFQIHAFMYMVHMGII
jgi:hypothetical protein